MRVKPTFGAITLAACLGVLFVILSLSAVRQKAPTFDETLHLFAGYAYLKWGDFGINPEHPPLAKIVGAIPLLVMDLNHQGVDRSDRNANQEIRNAPDEAEGSEEDPAAIGDGASPGSWRPDFTGSLRCQTAWYSSLSASSFSSNLRRGSRLISAGSR